MSMDRFELLELRRDDGVQTYHAREIATARPVQVHLFAEGQTRETLSLLAKLVYMPDAERRRVLDRGMFQGRPYVVTDRLAGFASLEEWIEEHSKPSLDEQFARLFDPDPIPVAPIPGPAAGLAGSPDPGRSASRSVATARASILGLVLGIGAALVFLAVLIAMFAFRPHQL